jgi:NNP family nitrate/nitrite transporter-like MFS transporter
MGFISGWATDRLDPRIIIAAVFLLTGISTALLGMVSGNTVLWLVFAQPLLAVCFFPAGFAALSATTGAGSRSVAVSMTVPIGFLIGGGAIPTWIGWMGDRGTFAGGIIVTGGVILSGFFLALFLKREKRIADG